MDGAQQVPLFFVLGLVGVQIIQSTSKEYFCYPMTLFDFLIDCGKANLNVVNQQTISHIIHTFKLYQNSYSFSLSSALVPQ